MKKVFMSLLVVAVVSMAFMSFNEEVKPAVKFTIPEWQQKINILTAAKAVIQRSDVPANVAIPLMDSLTSIQVSLINQINPQVPKQDSSKKKPNTNEKTK